MDKIIYIDKLKLCVSCLLAITYLIRIYSDLFPWYMAYLSGIILLFPLIVVYYNQGKKQMHVMFNDVMLWGMVPYVGGVFYTFVLSFLGKSLLDTKMRALSITAQFAYFVFLVIVLCSFFGEGVIDIVGNAMIISYFLILMIALFNIGFGGLWYYISNVFLGETALDHWFEKHDIGLSVGLILLYEVLFRPKRSITRTVLLSIILVICYKRIAIFSFFVTTFIWFLTNKWLPSFKIPIKVVMIAVGISCMVYVMLISSDLLVPFAMKFGFDFRGRMGFYRYMKKFYYWSVGFLGNGMGFTEKYMLMTSKKIGGYAAVHNDILKNYIDFGFIGSFMWMFWYIVKMPGNILKKYGSKAHYFYCISMIYAYIVYTTDNVSEYYIFQMTLYSMIICGCYIECQKQESMASI